MARTRRSAKAVQEEKLSTEIMGKNTTKSQTTKGGFMATSRKTSLPLTNSCWSCSDSNSLMMMSDTEDITSKEYHEDSSSSACSTPRSEEHRIPEILSCPPAPRKPKAVSRFSSISVTKFFVPADLDSLFPRQNISLKI